MNSLQARAMRAKSQKGLIRYAQWRIIRWLRRSNGRTKFSNKCANRPESERWSRSRTSKIWRKQWLWFNMTKSAARNKSEIKLWMKKISNLIRVWKRLEPPGNNRLGTESRLERLTKWRIVWTYQVSAKIKFHYLCCEQIPSLSITWRM